MVPEESKSVRNGINMLFLEIGHFRADMKKALLLIELIVTEIIVRKIVDGFRYQFKGKTAEKLTDG